MFGGFGLVLETLHGFKVALYMDLTNDTRRLMWTLAHAHGVGLALVHILIRLGLQLDRRGQPGGPTGVRCLMAASVLLPGGFFAGGVDLLMLATRAWAS